ncbi:RNA-guided endonuclease InsQ/TnpB family protein, partial [Mycobacterium sp.]|uniref:RNA-guided endonuclease InsQ/TnpB family protein n=1 Tax=Mycobacterium sp. TaxID=1785 RepID=UPI003C78F7C6
ANHRLARAISDAGWAEFARQLHYKQTWRGGQVVVADRWYPSSQLCSICGDRRTDLSLADRVFTCANGHCMDRDTNAATNLARWGQTRHDQYRSPDPQAGGRATNVHRRDGSDLGAPPACGGHPTSAGETEPNDVGTNVHAATAA